MPNGHLIIMPFFFSAKMNLCLSNSFNTFLSVVLPCPRLLAIINSLNNLVSMQVNFLNKSNALFVLNKKRFTHIGYSHMVVVVVIVVVVSGLGH